MNPQHRRASRSLVVLLFSGCCAWGAGSLASAAAPVPHPTPQQIRQLIELLGSDDFATREKACRKLEACDHRVFPALLKAAKTHPDAEVRGRANQVIERGFMPPIRALQRIGIEVETDLTQNNLTLGFIDATRARATDDMVKVMASFPHVRRVVLRYADKCTRVTFRHLADMPSLTQLGMRRTWETDGPVDLDGETLQGTAGFPNLVTLHLMGKVHVSASGLRAFRSPAKLLGLQIRSPRLTDQEVAEITRFENLVYLDLHSERLTDRSLQLISGLKRLETLGVNSSALTESGVACLKGMPCLKQVDIGSPKVKPITSWTPGVGRNSVRRKRASEEATTALPLFDGTHPFGRPDIREQTGRRPLDSGAVTRMMVGERR